MAAPEMEPSTSTSVSQSDQPLQRSGSDRSLGSKRGVSTQPRLRRSSKSGSSTLDLDTEKTQPRLRRLSKSGSSTLDLDTEDTQPRVRRFSKSGSSTLDLDTEDQSKTGSTARAVSTVRARSARRSRSKDAMRTLDSDQPGPASVVPVRQRIFRKSLSARDLLSDEKDTDFSSTTSESSVEKSMKLQRPSSLSKIQLHETTPSGGSQNATWAVTDPNTQEQLKQLESKNDLYREEYKRVQREKKILKKEKDDQAEAYEREIAELRREIHMSDANNKNLRTSLAAGAGSDFKLEELKEENARLRQELNETIDRASRMVEEREVAMDELLQEIENMKEQHNQARLLFDATLYKNKIRTETLDQQNDTYAQRLAELEDVIQTLTVSCVPKMLPRIGGSRKKV